MAERPERVTLSGRPPVEPLDAPAPDMTPARPGSKMHSDYWVLSEAERAKGFVRPVRQSYVHVGIRPKHPLRDLNEEERARYGVANYFKYEEYPEPRESSAVGRFWTEKELKSGCGSCTTMGRALSETYARNPKFYGSTFCCACNNHFPVAEFVWQGTDERVGS